MRTALYLEFEKSLDYHDEWYESDNDYLLPAQVMRLVHIYSVYTTEASFNGGNYKEALVTISLFMPRKSRHDLPFCEGVCQNLIFDEALLPMPEVDSNDEEYLPTADMDDPVWSEESVPDSQEPMCIHLIPRPATPTPQPNQVEMPQVPEWPATPPYNPINWKSPRARKYGYRHSLGYTRSYRMSMYHAHTSIH